MEVRLRAWYIRRPMTGETEDHDGDADLDYEELDRRREEVENGTVELIPWSTIEEKWRSG